MTRQSLLAAVLSTLLLGSTSLDAAKYVKGYTKKDGTHVSGHERRETTKTKSSTASRDAKGRIARSEEAKHQFETQTGYPHGRPGYVVDHIVPLACGGLDAPSNMQWQTVAEGKAKDKTERLGC